MHDVDKKMSKTTEGLVVALCADFGRRKRLIERKSAPYSVIMECRFLNYRMLDAAIQVAGERDAEIFIRDIGEGKGYASTDLYILSERVYKDRKAEVKIGIAKRLLLF